jgi:hypothetical protein
MAVASPLSRAAWPLAAGAALLFLVGLALHGSRPDPMVQFKPAGLMTGLTPDEANEIELVEGGRTRHFRRESAGWNTLPAVAEQIDGALRLLRNAKPLRIMTAEEVASVQASEYALLPDSLLVRVRASTGASFTIQFGGPNPLGAARYARVEGVEGIPLVPIHVADAWERLARGAP